MKNSNQSKIDEYYLNPNICLYCGNIIEIKENMRVYDARRKKFCNSSCSAKFNNSIKTKKDENIKTFICLNCGKENIFKRNTHNMFCNNKCQQEYQYKIYINKWKNGLENGISGEYGISRHIRRYLFEKYNNKCCKCGWGNINEFNGNIPLEIHHIDGDYTNNSESNLELLCPNCHSLTSTYKNNNKNGRKSRNKYN